MVNEEAKYPQDKIFESREQIKIKSCLFMKYLMKITSKKINQNIISFYYKIPDFSIKASREKNITFNFIKKLNIVDLHHIITKDPCSLNNFLKSDSEFVINLI